MPRTRSLFCLPVLIAATGIGFLASSAAAQDQEPLLAQARSVFSQPAMRLRFLTRINADAGLEEARTRVTASQVRLRLEGDLDGGFSYLVQTNFAAPSVLLDARVGWTHSPRFYAWAGRFKPFYSEEFILYARDLDFAFRSRVINDIGPNRQTGIQLGGQITDALSWSSGVFTGRRIAEGDGEPLVGIARVKVAGIEVGEGTLQVAVQGALGQDEAIQPFLTGGGAGYRGQGKLLGLDARLEMGPLMLDGEIHRGAWQPDVGADFNALGHYLTAGWMTTVRTQLLARWDRYRDPSQGEANDYVVLGFNAWPTSVATLQANWMVPLQDELAHRLLFTFQLGN
jgi:hypothetical protein